MSTALGGLGLISMASPLVGSLTAQALGWRAALGLTAAFGLASLAWLARHFEETAPARNPEPWKTPCRLWRRN